MDNINHPPSSASKELRESKSSKRGLRIVKVIWLIVCLNACLYQASRITILYLNYDVIAETWFFPTDPIIPPMVTICFYTYFRTPCEGRCPELVSNSRVFFENTFEFLELFANFTVKTSDGIYKTFYDESSMVEFYNRSVTTFKIGRDTCHAMDITRIFEPDSNKFYKQIHVRANRYQLMANFTIGGRVWPWHGVTIFLGPLDVLPVRIFDNSYYLDTDLTISYVKTQLRLLEHPYPTNCRDYRLDNVESQEHCIRMCAQNIALENGQPIPYWTPISKSQSSVDAIATEYESAPAICESKCSKVACQLEQFRFSVVTVKNSNNESYVQLYFPNEADLVVNYKPQLTFWEYATLLGSVFGLWFGLSVGNLFELSIKISKINKIKKINPHAIIETIK